MRDKNVHIVVIFFGLLLFVLLTMYYLYYNSEDISHKFEYFSRFNAPYAQYVGGLYYIKYPFSSNNDDLVFTKNVRDIKQLVSYVKNTPERGLIPEKRPVISEKQPSFIIRKSSDVEKKGQRENFNPFRLSAIPKKKEPIDISDTKPLEKKETLDKIPLVQHSTNKDSLEKRQIEESDNSGNSKSSTTTILLMVVVILPAFVIILVIVGLVVSHMWSDLLFPKGEGFRGNFGYVISHRDKDKYLINVNSRVDIESGTRFDSNGKCVEGCTLVSRGNKKYSTGRRRTTTTRTRVNGSKRARGRSKGKRKNKKNIRKKKVTFGDDDIFEYSANPVIKSKIDQLLMKEINGNRKLNGRGNSKKPNVEQSIIDDIGLLDTI